MEKEWEKLGKLPAWQLTKVRNKKEVIEEAWNKGRKVHLASLVDMCHLKNAELEAKHQKYQGRVVFRGDIVKDDSGSYAEFTEQGSSASQMTVAKVMGIISRHWDAQDKQQMPCPLKPRSKRKMHRRYCKFQNQIAQIFGYVYQNTNGNHGPVWKTLLFLLNGIFTVILGQDYYGNGNF